MTANDYAAYRLAILAKLVKEISGPPTAAQPLPSGRRTAAAVDKAGRTY